MLSYLAYTTSYPSSILSRSLPTSIAGVCPSSSRQTTISPLAKLNPAISAACCPKFFDISAPITFSYFDAILLIVLNVPSGDESFIRIISYV